LVISAQAIIEPQEVKNMPLTRIEQIFKILRDSSVKRIFLIVPTVPFCGAGTDEEFACILPLQDEYKSCKMFNIPQVKDLVSLSYGEGFFCSSPASGSTV
jgi:hypothetical protein